jgi:hypothetical protein
MSSSCTGAGGGDGAWCHGQCGVWLQPSAVSSQASAPARAALAVAGLTFMGFSSVYRSAYHTR